MYGERMIRSRDLVALVCACVGCTSSGDGGGGGGGGDTDRARGNEAKWILPAVCDGPYLQVMLDAPADQHVRMFGKAAHRNSQGRAYYNGTEADVGAGSTITIDVGGVARTVAVPPRPTYPYTLIGAMVRHKYAGHWNGHGTLGTQKWEVRADVGADGALRFPLPCGTKSAKPAASGPAGKFELVDNEPFYAAAYGDAFLDRSNLDDNIDLSFDLAIDGWGGAATLKLAGKLSVSQLVGALYAARLTTGQGLAWAPERAVGARVLFVMNGHARTDLLHGSRVRDAAAVAVATSKAVGIDPCQYAVTGGLGFGSVNRTRADTHVVVYAAKSGKQLATKTIAGKPPTCPDSITRTTYKDRSGESSSQDVEGVTGVPNVEDALKWAERAAR